MVPHALPIPNVLRRDAFGVFAAIMRVRKTVIAVKLLVPWARAHEFARLLLAPAPWDCLMHPLRQDLL